MMKALSWCIAAAAWLAAFPLAAADADNGRMLAQRHCAACHAIAPGARNEVADAPPFDVIGRKHGFSAEELALAMLTPHPKMNFVPARRDVADLAAFIASLAR